MSKFSNFGSAPRLKLAKKTSTGKLYVNYLEYGELRRVLTPNGKIQSRKRTALSAQEQRLVARAVRRARYMALLPFTSATL